MHISVVIVVANLRQRIETVCEIIDHSLKSLNFNYEILFFDNASRDGTRILLEQIMLRRGHIRVMGSKKRCGFGFALRMLLEKAQGDVIAYYDPSMAIKLETLPFLMEKMCDADMVVASRFFDRITAHTLQRSFSFRIYEALCRWVLRIPIKDIQPSLFFLHREMIAKLDLHSQNRNIFPEMFLKVQRKDFILQECCVEKRSLAAISPLQQTCSFLEILDLFRLKS